MRNISTITKLALTVMAASVLAACGSDSGTTAATTTTATTTTTTPAGGSSSSSSSSGSTTTGAAPSAATGALKSDQATANGLVAAVNGGVATFVSTDALKSAPTAAQISDLPTGVVTTINCSTFATAGLNVCTGSYTIDSNITGAITSGSSLTVTYNNIKYSALPDFTYNGTLKTTYDRYVSATDFAVTTTYTNLTLGAGATPLNGTSTCDYKGGTATCGYNVGDTFVSNYTISTSGTTTTVSSGLIRANYAGASGYVDCSYSGWSYNSATSVTGAGGVVTVTGISGTVAKITSNGAGKYSVDITVGGTKTTYTVG
jgi:hypothetical protein